MNPASSRVSSPPGVLPHPSTLPHSQGTPAHSASSESPQPPNQQGQGAYAYSSFTTDDEFWATLVSNGPDTLGAQSTPSTGLGNSTQSSALALDAAFDALNSGAFSQSPQQLHQQSQPLSNLQQQPQPPSAAEADFFAQDLDQILGSANLPASTWQQLEAIGSTSHPASTYSLDLGGFTQSAQSVPYSTQLFQPQQAQQAYQGSIHGSAYAGGFATTGSAFNFPRAVPTFSVYSGQDEQHSVYSETSAYLSNTGHPQVFQNPGSPTYQINTLPEELDMSHFGLTAPRSTYGGTNLSSVAPSSLINGISTASVMSAGSQYPGEGPDAGEKKHQCPHCPRAFARAYNLKTHIATHDPQRPKPYKCPYASCGRGFSRKHDLGRHVGSVHEKGERGSERGGAMSERGGTMSERGGSGEAPNGVNGNAVNGGAEKVWCDGCGRGWVKGMKSGCVCDEKDRETGRVKWEDTK